MSATCCLGSTARSDLRSVVEFGHQHFTQLGQGPGLLVAHRLGSQAPLLGNFGRREPLQRCPNHIRLTRLQTAIDGVIQLDPADAKEWARRCATSEGILVGISSGATLAAIAQKLPDLPKGVRVLGFNYDTGERYLSVADFLPE